MDKRISTLPNEVWIDIPDHHGYQASSLGRIRIVDSTYCRVPYIRMHRGYEYIAIYSNGKRKCKRIHRLVAEAFYGKSELTVNHIDGVKTNNSISNLEFLTIEENLQHAFRTGLMKNRNPRGTVYWHKRSRKWIARYRSKKKEFYLGCFTDRDQAKIALDTAINGCLYLPQ